MKKLLLTVLGPFFAVIAAVVGFIWWERGAPPGFRPTAVAVDPTTINREHRGVRITGTAHYEARLKQTADGSDDVWYVYPLMMKGDAVGRTIHVLVRTTTEPDTFYGLEDRTFEGFARPPGRLVPRKAREQLEEKGYTFTDDYVLVEEWVD